MRDGKSRALRHCVFILALFVSAFLANAVQAAEGRLAHMSIFSQAMGKQWWGFNVYLPRNYDFSRASYPVIYVLHGGGSDENGMTFIAKNYVEGLIQAGKIPEVILVFPNGGRDSFFLDNGVVRQQTENPDQHIIRELVPFIDTNFRTIADRQHRSIMGFSMGGYGAYHFAFKYPELFSAVAPCAAGGPYGPNGLIVNYSPAEKPQSLAVSNAARIRPDFRIVISVGAQDLVPYNNEFSQILQRQGIAHDYLVLPGVGHDINAIMNQSGLKIFQTLTASRPFDE